MIKFFAQLLDLIYKKQCYFCKKTHENSVMCTKCYEEIELLQPKPIIHIDEIPVFSATVYGKNMQKLIRGLKYHNKKELAVYQARFMADYWNNIPEKKNSYVIVPVPLFINREKKRKYNHMLLVAEELAKLCNYNVKNNLIYRIKNTKPQYKLSIKERQKNLHNAFEVKKQNYNNENILLIDDILTTGTTLTEIVKELKKNGITNITCFTTSCTASHI